MQDFQTTTLQAGGCLSANSDLKISDLAGAAGADKIKSHINAQPKAKRQPKKPKDPNEVGVIVPQTPLEKAQAEVRQHPS